MDYEIVSLFNGFPAKSSRGFLGWSSVYLIKVKENEETKLILFDTGGYNERFELIKRLEALNVSVEDIDIIFISHLHFDHAVNWVLFPNADIYISSGELINEKENTDMMVPNFHSDQLRKHKRIKYVECGDALYGFDVVSLPGHTLNLVGLKVGKTFLVSDAIKNRSETVLNGELSNVINEKLARKTIEYLMNNADIIYPGHDVPLMKKSESWEPLITNEMSILYSNSIKDMDGESEIKLNINI